MARRERVRWVRAATITTVDALSDYLNNRLSRLGALLTGIIARANSATTDLERTRLNFVDTASLTWVLTDDPTNDEIKVEGTAAGGGGGAPTTAKYITQTPDAGLSAEQALSVLATGLVKNTTATGVLSIAVAGTDYLAPTSFKTASIAFTDGDTSRRVTITDAAVGAASKITGTVIRPDTTVVDDKGYVYLPTVVLRSAGSFDVNVNVFDWGGEDPVGDPPNETVTYAYLVL